MNSTVHQESFGFYPINPLHPKCKENLLMVLKSWVKFLVEEIWKTHLLKLLTKVNPTLTWTKEETFNCLWFCS